jgi:hypothetical protein
MAHEKHSEKLDQQQKQQELQHDVGGSTSWVADAAIVGGVIGGAILLKNPSLIEKGVSSVKDAAEMFSDAASRGFSKDATSIPIEHVPSGQEDPPEFNPGSDIFRVPTVSDPPEFNPNLRAATKNASTVDWRAEQDLRNLPLSSGEPEAAIGTYSTPVVDHEETSFEWLRQQAPTADNTWQHESFSDTHALLRHLAAGHSD